ncbi:hypothetical protein PT974_08388 [Cladobotryum mycophilum]|uniref:Uncharacterized protein n=1 Tax=Cladobotryum mycophilum TaxID=491253 RepID=A0ABR0SE64_9HYPO
MPDNPVNISSSSSTTPQTNGRSTQQPSPTSSATPINRPHRRGDPVIIGLEEHIRILSIRADVLRGQDEHLSQLFWDYQRLNEHTVQVIRQLNDVRREMVRKMNMTICTMNRGKLFDERIFPLLNAETGRQIVGFPARPCDMFVMDDAEIDAILVAAGHEALTFETLTTKRWFLHHISIEI